MKRFGKFLLILGVMVGAYLYATPYLALWNLKSALDAQDARGIAAAVDFPAVRERLKERVNIAIRERLKEQANINVAEEAAGQIDSPVASIGSVLVGTVFESLAGVVVEMVIDKVITPEGIVSVLRHGRLVQPGGTDGAGVVGDAGEGESALDAFNKRRVRYEGINRIAVDVQGEKGSISLILQRATLFAPWRVVDIQGLSAEG